MSRRNQRRLSFGAAFDEDEWAAAVEEAHEEVTQQSGSIFDVVIAAQNNDFLSAGSTERYNAGGGMGSYGGAQNAVAAAARKMKNNALPKIKSFSLPEVYSGGGGGGGDDTLREEDEEEDEDQQEQHYTGRYGIRGPGGADGADGADADEDDAPPPRMRQRRASIELAAAYIEKVAQASASIANGGKGKSQGKGKGKGKGKGQGQGIISKLGHRDSMKTRRTGVLKEAKRELSQLAKSQSADSMLPSLLTHSPDRSASRMGSRRNSGTLTPPSLLAASSAAAAASLFGGGGGGGGGGDGGSSSINVSSSSDGIGGGGGSGGGGAADLQAPTFGPRRMKRRSSVSEMESLVRHAGVGAGFHDSDGIGQSRNRAWGSAGAGGVWKKDTQVWHSVVDGVLMSILRPPSDFEALEKAREPKETNIAGKKAKRERSPRKISFHVGTSMESGPVSFVKTFKKDDVIDAKLRWKPRYNKAASDRHDHGLNYNVKFQQSRLHALLEAEKDTEGGGGGGGSGGANGSGRGSSGDVGSRGGSATSITLPSHTSTNPAAGGGGGTGSSSSISSISSSSSGSSSNSSSNRSKKDGTKTAERKSLLGIAVPRGGGGSFRSGAKSPGHTPGKALKAGGRR